MSEPDDPKQPPEDPKESADAPKESADAPKESADAPKEPSSPEPKPAAPAGEAEEAAVDVEEAAVGDVEEAGVDPAVEEMKARLEEEMRTIRVEDLILQSTVSILSLAARRIAKDDERDLEQGKAGIDASKALLDFLPDDAAGQVREAVSELQLLYAKHASEAT
jgi:hypothetical protein